MCCLPVGIFGARGRSLLSLRRRDAALDGEGGAVGARDAQRGSIAADLLGCYALGRQDGRLSLLITYFPGMTRCEWWLASCLSGRPRCRGTDQSHMVDIRAATCKFALETRKGRIRYLLSHALLARCRRKDGCPGGTDCDAAVGLHGHKQVFLVPAVRARHVRVAVAGLRSQRGLLGGDGGGHERMFARHWALAGL
jgi:hypothetical protein